MSVSVANDVSPGVMNERVDLFKRKERFKIPPKVPQQIQSFYEAMGVPPSYYLNKKTQAERLRRSESLKTVKEMQKEIDKTDNPFINVLVRIKDDFEEDNSNRVKNTSLALSHWKNQLVPMIAFKDEKSLIVFKYFRRLIPPRTSQRVSFQTMVPAALPLHEGNVSPVVRKKANVKQISRRSSVPVVQTKIDVLPGARRKSVNNTMQKVTMFSELRSYYDHITNEVKNEESYDPSMYTDQALLKRDALRFDEDIRKALSKIYIMKDQNRDAQIGKDEYIELSLRLQRLVIGKVEMHSALQIANMEWDFDRQGTDFLNFDRLILSFFQLADIWTRRTTSWHSCEMLPLWL